MIMADGPAGIRLQRSYEVNRENDSVYGIGVLGSLENGFLVTEKPHQNADTYYQYCTAFPGWYSFGAVLESAAVERVWRNDS